MADVRFGFSTHQCVSFCVLASLFVFAHCLDLCIEVKKEYGRMGFKEDNVPITPISGDHLQICPQGSTCCTPDMETKLKSLSRKEYQNVANDAFRIIKSTFVSRTKKFDEFFTELLENAKNDLHEMFTRTYGLFYVSNSEVFANLFRDLRSYYKGKDSSLVDILNKFFINLLQKMFELLNAEYHFDEDYLHCVTRHMDALKPFGDIPQKLKLQVKRAFIAARTFVQGLAIGRDVILAMEGINPTDACTRGMTRMMYCPHCRGLTRTKPCNNYCLNTMKGCLAHHSELNKAWNEYIEALQMVAARLEGPFNIETVVDPIDVKISEAIMNFQEGSEAVQEKIFKGCGQPRMNPNPRRHKREDGSSHYEDYAFGRDFMKKGNKNSGERQQITAAGTNLDRLVRDIKEKVQQAKDFWVQLPYTICNGDIAAQPDLDEDCWNGQDRARYVPAVQKDGRIYQVNNPEVTVDVQEDNGIISMQIYNLKLITGKLQNAYNGLEVEWTKSQPSIDIDGSGDDLETSGDDRITEGSGGARGDDEDLASGSGSGMEPDDEDYPRTTKRPGPNQGFDFVDTRGPKYNTPKQEMRDPDSGAPMWSSSILLLAAVLLQCVVRWL